MAENKKPSNTTKELVELEDIRENVVILKNGSLRMLLRVSAINFDLKSEDEQKAIVLGFQNFLNSIDFPVQISIQSRKIDIKPYLEYLNQNLDNIKNELLRIQAMEYIEFITGLTELSNIMSKEFYLVVPFYLIEAPVTKQGLLGSVQSLLRPSDTVKKLDDEKFATYKNQLSQRAILLSEGLSSLGMKIEEMQESELKSMFYNLYNGR